MSLGINFTCNEVTVAPERPNRRIKFVFFKILAIEQLNDFIFVDLIVLELFQDIIRI